MFRFLLNTTPEWFIFAALSLLFILFVVLTRFFLRHNPNYLIKNFTNGVNFLRVLSTLNAIVFGFVVVILWQLFGATVTNVSQEADTLAMIVRDAQGLDSNGGNAIINAAGEYVRDVTTDGWAAMREGKRSEVTAKSITKLFTAVETYNPVTEKQKLLYTEILANLNKALEARRNRLERLDSKVPGPIMCLLVLESMLILTFLCMLQSVDDLKEFKQGLPIYFTALVIGFTFAVIVDLDYPFSGKIIVSNEVFKQGILAEFFKHP